VIVQSLQDRVDESPFEVPEPIELELKRLELCMAKPWYRLAMIEHQIVGGGLQFFLADTT
jgi:hypothetical protein